MRVSSHRYLDEAVIGTGLVSERAPQHITTYGHMTDALNRECRTLRRQGAAALDLAWVAAGRLDGYFEFGLKPWDMAAAAVIVREAGGFVSDTDGGDRFLETGNVVAANPRLIRQLLRTVRNGTEAALGNG